MVVVVTVVEVLLPCQYSARIRQLEEEVTFTVSLPPCSWQVAAHTQQYHAMCELPWQEELQELLGLPYCIQWILPKRKSLF
jgi:hypothetical protein